LLLVVPRRVQRELAEEFADGVEDPDVQVADEDQDPGAGVPAADEDGVKPAFVPQDDHAAGSMRSWRTSCVHGRTPVQLRSWLEPIGHA
jgi:hypothetical protein